MPNHSSYPTLYDHCKTISITKLKEWGFLEPDSYKSGVISWSRNGNELGRVSFAIDTNSLAPNLKLDYKCNEKTIEYEVKLISIPSNLGKGDVWFFLCPLTSKRCRKLYLVQKYFYHRDAFSNCMYEKQTESHKYRSRNVLFDKLNMSKRAGEEINSKHFKPYYSAQPTKRYKRLLRKIQSASKISEADVLSRFKS